MILSQNKLVRLYKVVMVLSVALSALSLTSFSLAAQNRTSSYSYRWDTFDVQGEKTGVVASRADNVEEAMGRVKGRRYYSPSGRVYKGGSVLKTAKTMLSVQPDMAKVKERIAYSTEVMERRGPECALYNWFIDILMARVETLSGKKVDIGFANRGGVRLDMPKGDVLLDDLMSMFPFRNNLCFLELKGKDIRAILEHQAGRSWQIVGGARCVVKNRKLESVEIDGEPLDDEKTYGVATISFLLDGGDGFAIAKNSLSLEIFDEYIIDAILPYVRKLTEEGKNIEYKTDGRIIIIKDS